MAGKDEGAGSAHQAAGIVLRGSSWQGKMGARGAQAKLRESPFGAVTIVVVEGYMVEVCWSWDEGTVMAAGGARCTVEVRCSWDEGTVMVAGGARCTMEVRWSWDEGTVMAVKEHGARWKCAGLG